MDNSEFRRFLGLVKFAFGSERVKVKYFFSLTVNLTEFEKFQAVPYIRVTCTTTLEIPKLIIRKVLNFGHYNWSYRRFMDKPISAAFSFQVQDHESRQFLSNFKGGIK